MGLRDLDRRAEGLSGSRLHRLVAVAGLPVLVGVIFMAAAVGRLRDGDGIALALVGAALLIGGPLLGVHLHNRRQRG